MRLSEIIIQYRKEHDISQREFARRCGFSNAYLSMLENEVNPTTGKQITPTLEKYFAIAKAMNMEAGELMEMADDMLVEINPMPAELSKDEKELIRKFRQLDDRGRAAVMNTLNYEYRMMEK